MQLQLSEAGVLWLPARSGIPGKAQDRENVHLDPNRSQENCPAEVESEFLRKAGNAFLSGLFPGSGAEAKTPTFQCP